MNITHYLMPQRFNEAEAKALIAALEKASGLRLRWAPDEDALTPVAGWVVVEPLGIGSELRIGLYTLEDFVKLKAIARLKDVPFAVPNEAAAKIAHEKVTFEKFGGITVDRSTYPVKPDRETHVLDEVGVLDSKAGQDATLLSEGTAAKLLLPE